MAADEFGFDPAMSQDALAKRHRELVRRFHPDAHPGAGADERAALERRMQALNEAWDRVRRAAPPVQSAAARAYAPAPPRRPMPPPPWQQPPRHSPAPSVAQAARRPAGTAPRPPEPTPERLQSSRRRGRWLTVSGVALVIAGAAAVWARSSPPDDRRGSIPSACPARRARAPLATIEAATQTGRTVVLAGTIANPFEATVDIRAVEVRYRYRTFANLPRDELLELEITTPPLAAGEGEQFRWTGTVAEAGTAGTATVDGVEGAWVGDVVAAGCPIR